MVLLQVYKYSWTQCYQDQSFIMADVQVDGNKSCEMCNTHCEFYFWDLQTTRSDQMRGESEGKLFFSFYRHQHQWGGVDLSAAIQCITDWVWRQYSGQTQLSFSLAMHRRTEEYYAIHHLAEYCKVPELYSTIECPRHPHSIFCALPPLQSK